MKKKIESGAIRRVRQPDYDPFAEAACINLERPPKHCRLGLVEDGDEVLGRASELLLRLYLLVHDLAHRYNEIVGYIESANIGRLDRNIERRRSGLPLHLVADVELQILEREREEIRFRLTATQNIFANILVLEFRAARERATIFREGGLLVARGYKDDVGLDSIEVDGETVKFSGGMITRSLEQ